MFAIAAAVLFILGVVVPDGVDSHTTTFWLLLGLAALAVHFAFDVAFPRLKRRD